MARAIRSTEKHEAIPGLNGEEERLYAQIPKDVRYIHHVSFSSSAIEGKLFGEDADLIEIPEWSHFPELEADEPIKPRGKPLNAHNEATLFLRYNYACYRLSLLVKAQKRYRSSSRASRMIVWHTRAMASRADLARSNLALVLSMAKRTKIPNVEFSELISEGNMALLRAIEKFDVSRGFKFSTYACRTILKSFNKLAIKNGRYHQHFPIEFDSTTDMHPTSTAKGSESGDFAAANEAINSVMGTLTGMIKLLTPVEKEVIIGRFAIVTRGKGKTLVEVGREVGLTNRRVRQIQNQALAKMRAVIDDYI